MARTMYETEAHLEKERSVIWLICEKFKCEASKLPIKYGLDYALSRDGKIAAFCEIKCRNYPFSHFLDGYAISLNKIITAKQISETTGLPFILVISCEDGVYYAKMTEFKNIPTVMGGRKDRGDWQDMEPMAVLQASEFKKIVSK